MKSVKKNKRRIWLLAGVMGGAVAMGTVAAVAASCSQAASTQVSNGDASSAEQQSDIQYLDGKGMGSVAQSSYAKIVDPLPASPTDQDNQTYQDGISNTFAFAGGAAVAPDWNSSQDLKNFVNLFEDNVRDINADYTDENSVLSTVGRLTINVASPTDGIDETVAKLAPDQAIGRLDPKNVVYMVGTEGNPPADYKQSVKNLISGALALRNGTANLILMEADGASGDLAQHNADLVTAVREWYDDSTSVTKDNDLARVQIVTADDYAKAKASLQAGALQEQNALAKALYDKLNGDMSKPYQDIEPDAGISQYAGTDRNPSNGANIQDVWVEENSQSYNNPINSASPGNHTTSLFLGVDNSTLNFKEGDIVKWQVKYPALGLTVSDDAKLVSSANQPPYTGLQDNELGLEIPEIPSDAITSGNHQDGTVGTPSLSQKVQITVTDPNGDDYNVWAGAIGDTNHSTYVNNKDRAQDGATPGNMADASVWEKAGATADELTTALTPLATSDGYNTLGTAQVDRQAKFLAQFNDKSKPMTWLFLGSTSEQRSGDNADGTLAYNNYAQIIEKSVKGEWGRTDDTFIDAAMIGNYMNRQNEANVKAALIAKYSPDVVVMSFGLTEMMDTTTHTQDNPSPFTKESVPVSATEPPTNPSSGFWDNQKYVIQAASQNGKQPFVVINPVAPTASTDKSLYGAKYNTQAGNTANPSLLGDSDANPVGGNMDTRGVATFYNAYFDNYLGSDGSKAGKWISAIDPNVLYNHSQNDQLTPIYKDYSKWIGQDGLFMSDDLLSGPNAHLIKARTIMGTLGVNVLNSELRDYMLTRNVQDATAGTTIDQSLQPNLAANQPRAAGLSDWNQAATKADATFFNVSATTVNDSRNVYIPGSADTGTDDGYAGSSTGVATYGAFGIYATRLTYAAQAYLNGKTALTADDAQVGQGFLSVDIPESAWNPTPSSGTSADRTYQVVWSPSSFGSNPALIRGVAYDPTRTSNPNAYTNVLIFDMPMNVVNGYQLAAGSTVSGYVLANAAPDGKSVYRYDFAPYTAVAPADGTGQ